MAAGTTILLKRKAGAFNGGDLATGEAGVDTTNGDLYFSTDGTTVIQIDVSGISGGDALTSNSLAQFAATTSAEVAALISDETGSGALVFGTSPTIYTPTIVDDDGDTIVEFVDSLASSVNYLSITNATSSSPPTISVASTVDTNVDIEIHALGSGVVKLVGGLDVDGLDVVTELDDKVSKQIGADTSVGVWDSFGDLQGSTQLLIDSNRIDIDNASDLIFAEKADHSITPAAGFGQLWVKNDTPCSLIFTADDGTDYDLTTVSGDALTSNSLAQFAATTSAEMAALISDETGSGALVFGTSPTIATPDLTLKTGTAPTAEGDIEWNSTNNTILVGDGATTKTFSSDADISITESQVSDLGTAATLNADTDVSSNSWVLDEDTLSSDSATKLATQQSIKAYIDAAILAVIPIGGTTWFADDTEPANWLECDGSAISRTTYSELFAVIGTWWGVGDGSTTFNLPDLRGEFIRGWDNAKGTDSGRAFASYQADDFLAHTHVQNSHAHTSANHTHTGARRGSQNGQSGSNRYSATSSTSTASANVTVHSATATNQNAGDNESGPDETRPRNYAMMPIIRYQ